MSRKSFLVNVMEKLPGFLTMSALFILVVGAMGLVYSLSKAWEKFNVLLPVSCREFAEALLRENALDYRVICDRPEVPGRCDWRKKQIFLSYGGNNKSLGAVFQAAHEVGHAVYGPTIVIRNLTIIWALLLAWFLFCVWDGYAGDTAIWKYALAIAICVLLVRSADLWFDEQRAVKYARDQLKKFINEPDVKKMLQVHYLAYCFLNILIPVSVSGMFLCAGRFFWCIGRLLDGDNACLAVFAKSF